jgi:hypothetical protein
MIPPARRANTMTRARDTASTDGQVQLPAFGEGERTGQRTGAESHRHRAAPGVPLDRGSGPGPHRRLLLAAVIEALMEADLRAAGVAYPDLDDQVISPRRALREPGRIRRVTTTVA